MSDNTQELDEVAQLLGIYLEEIDVDGYMPITVNRQTLAHIKDWHNKQIEEVLDRLESERDSHDADTGCSDELGYIPLSAIQAERNKLKEMK